jgi:hypothetical protein
MTGIHLVIFCSQEYRELFLDHCVFSIEQFVQDKIASKLIVSDISFDYKDFDVINDRELWSKFDPDFNHKTLFDDTWTKQQILKLSVDKIKQGNVLIVDADLIFLKPVRFVKGGKFNFYTGNEFDPRYFHLIKDTLGIEKQLENSFITDFELFNTDILDDLKSEIKERKHTEWLLALSSLLTPSAEVFASNKDSECLLSEYELYGSYVLSFHRDRVNKVIKPIRYRDWAYFKADYIKETSSAKLIEQLRRRYKNYYQSIRVGSRIETLLSLI